MDKPLYIIVGLSGAGKSTALRVFEDHRFFAVDGLPIGVAPEVVGIMHSGEMAHFQGMAISLDIRQNDFLEQYKKIVEKLANQGFAPKIIFLEANDQTIIQRYAATRRPHPLEQNKSGLEAAIESERTLLRPIRDQADMVIDTTNMSIHDLRRRLQNQISGKDNRKLKISLISFGFKNGIPQDADFLFDLRFLPNPYFVESLREKNGLDKDVADYVFTSETTHNYLIKLQNFLSFVLTCMENEGRYRVTLALGCTGGRHRSVAFVDVLAKHLRQMEYQVTTTQRDINKL